MEKINFSDNVEIGGRVLHLQTNTLPGKERIVSTLFDQGEVIEQREKEVGRDFSPDILRSAVEEIHRARKKEIGLINQMIPRIRQMHHLPSLFRLGRLLISWRLFADARKVLEAACASPDPDARSVLLLSEVFSKQNQPQEAIRILKEAMEKFPDEPEISLQLGWIFNRMREQGPAEAAIQETVENHPDLGKAQFLRGILLLGKLSRGEAGESSDPLPTVDALKRAVGLAPEYRLKIVAEAIKYIYEKEYRLALEILEQVYDRTHIPLSEESDYFYLNFLYGDGGRDEAAIRKFQTHIQKVLERIPNYPERLSELGMTHLILAHEEIRKAAETFAESDDISENKPLSRFTEKTADISQRIGELLKQYFKEGG